MYDTKLEYETDEALLEAEHDNMAVDAFAKEMKDKLSKARAKGRSGWNDKKACSDEYLVYLFFKHLKKANDGNFVDLANFLMFFHMRDSNPNVLNLLKDLFKVDFEADTDAMKPKTCEGCLFGKITLNSVICGKSGTYKEYDDYCKYHEPKDNA